MAAISLSSYLLFYNQSRATRSTTLVDGYARASVLHGTHKGKKKVRTAHVWLLMSIGRFKRLSQKWCIFGQKTKNKVHHRSSHQLLWEILFCNWKKTNPASVMAGMILPLLKKENDLTVQVQTTERNGWDACLPPGCRWGARRLSANWTAFRWGPWPCASHACEP